MIDLQSGAVVAGLILLFWASMAGLLILFDRIVQKHADRIENLIPIWAVPELTNAAQHVASTTGSVVYGALKERTEKTEWDGDDIALGELKKWLEARGLKIVQSGEGETVTVGTTVTVEGNGDDA